MDYVYHYASPLGGITLRSDGHALTGLMFDGEKYFKETIDSRSADTELPAFAETVRWLDTYFSGKDPGFLPSVTIRYL